jgi:hypothetical protein
MDLETIAHAIRNTDLFTAVRQSELFYPIVMSTHLTCIAIFGGMIFATNLRLLDFSFTSYPAGSMIRTLRPWKHFGLLLMVTCGILLAGSKADTYLPNTFFRLKLLLLSLLAVHAFVFRDIYHNTNALDTAGKMPGRAKLAAALSILLWISVACAGRWIAYWDSPKAIF